MGTAPSTGRPIDKVSVTIEDPNQKPNAIIIHHKCDEKKEMTPDEEAQMQEIIDGAKDLSIGAKTVPRTAQLSASNK